MKVEAVLRPSRKPNGFFQIMEERRERKEPQELGLHGGSMAGARAGDIDRSRQNGDRGNRGGAPAATSFATADVHQNDTSLGFAKRKHCPMLAVMTMRTVVTSLAFACVSVAISAGVLVPLLLP